MAFAVSDLEQFLDILRAHPEWRARVRTEVVGEELLSLPELVRELAEAQRRTEVRLDALIVQVAELAEAQRRTEARLDALIVQVEGLTRQVSNLAGRTGNLEGEAYENRWARNAPSRMSAHLRRPHVVWLHDIPELDAAHAEGRFSRDEWAELAVLDILVAGRDPDAPTGPLLYAAVELSMTIDERDVARAVRRADLIRRAGVAVRAFVGGQSIRPEAADLAGRLAVTVVVDKAEAA